MGMIIFMKRFVVVHESLPQNKRKHKKTKVFYSKLMNSRTRLSLPSSTSSHGDEKRRIKRLRERRRARSQEGEEEEEEPTKNSIFSFFLSQSL